MSSLQTTVDKNALTSLSRGLKVLQFLSLSEQEVVRFSEIKQQFPELTDSTLSRLLRSLEVDGYLQRAQPAGYMSGPALRGWLGQLKRPANPGEVFRRAILELVRKSNESAAIVLLDGERLNVVASEVASGAVAVIKVGETLHYEADHAASLAVLGMLTCERRATLMESPYSRLSGERAFQAACRTIEIDDGVYWDSSYERPGICRIALPFRIGNYIGAIFLCLTIESATQNYARFVGLLQEQQARIVKEIG